MSKKIVSLLLCAVLALAMTACGGGSSGSGGNAPAATDSKPITMKFYSAWAENNSNLIDMQKFIDKVSDKSGGTITIEWGGGPEAIPTYQLAEAVKNQVTDIVWSAHTYNVSHIPVMEGMKLTSGAEMRANGGFEFVDELYVKNLNTHYLGCVTDGLTYNLYSKKEIKSFDDFKGMTIRATPAYQAFVEALGAGVVNPAPGEAYQALERNVIQGYGWPSFGIMDYGWQEVSEYIIEPAFYNVDVAVFVSDKMWKQLSESQRQALLDAGREVEEEAGAYYTKAIAEDKAKLVDGGMKINQLPDDLAAEYIKLAYDKAWESVLTNDPENGPKLQGFTSYGK